MLRLVRTLILASLVFCTACEPPNIAVVVGGDMGWSGFGFLGNDRVITPTLDKL